MKIYIFNINQLEGDISKYISMVDIDRQEKIECLKFEEDKRRSLGAGLALKYALKSEGFVYEELSFNTDDRGKPHIVQIGNASINEAFPIYYNISHSGDYALVVVSHSEIGIDIEKIKSCNMKLAKRHFTDGEYEYIQKKCEDKQAEAFYVIWTLKEAYLKMTGEGIRRSLNSFELQIKENQAGIKDNHQYKMNVIKDIDGYIVSTCSLKDEEIIIEEIIL